MKRRQSRGRRGRFVKNTTARVFGFTADVCPFCRGLFTWEFGTPRPKTCKHCGFTLPEEPGPRHCDRRGVQ